MALLEVEDLSIAFQTDAGPVVAVDGISFDLEAGEILGLVGESGCGKSVTAMSLLGLSPNDGRTVTGSIRLEGRDLRRLALRQLREIRGRDIAMIFQDPMTSLNPVFTVGRQIDEVLRRHKGMNRREARQRTVELLRLVDIPLPAARADQYPHQLSGGMRQRIMIAMALACDAKVLIADEPTTALDVTVQAGILDLLRDIRDRLGTSIIVITHDLGVIADVADRVIVMYAGRKIEEAPVDRLFGAPQHPYTMGLLGAVPGRATSNGGTHRLVEIPGMVPTMRDSPDSCTFAPRCTRASERCRAKRPPLLTAGGKHACACFHPGLLED